MHLAGSLENTLPSTGTGQVVGRIIVAHQGRNTAERELRPGRLVIGRTAENDLQIDSKFISRHHCQIVTQVDSCVIEDLNSTNGIYVQSKRVRRHNLNDGDIVTVGQHELMYLDERIPRLRIAADLQEPDAEILDRP
jgi:pSer/pThr/pTyr-binding forkhead associated (FHA) protein